MAVLSANKQRNPKASCGAIHTAVLRLAGYTNFGGGSATHEVYSGSMMVCDVSDTDGYFRAVPLSSSTNMASGDIFGGVSLERQSVTSSDTADGSVLCTVARDGVWPFAVGSVAITDIGAPAYASDDDTITTTSTNNLWCGIIEDVDATNVYVNIAPAFLRTNTAT